MFNGYQLHANSRFCKYTCDAARPDEGETPHSSCPVTWSLRPGGIGIGDRLLQQVLSFLVNSRNAAHAIFTLAASLIVTVVMLNGSSDGLLLSSVSSRNMMRIYANDIQMGLPSHELTDEEKRAISDMPVH